GMNPQESGVFIDFVKRLVSEKDISVMLIEHDMKVVMSVSERITVLDQGEKIAEGTPDQIKSNARVIEAYLGKAKEARA
ncbi:MAG: ABC transporter ATP-binding protein, partial [Candidatus Nanopelagicaceae bacterium]